jgi:hypothetical protein
MKIAPHVAAAALEKFKDHPRFAEAYVSAQRKYTKANRKEKRVLKAAPVAIGAFLLEAIGVVGASSFVAGAVGYGVIIGASIGLNYAAQSLLSRGSGPLDNSSAGALNDNAIKYNERQATPSKRIIYGTCQVGGALFFEAVKPPYLYQGFLICAEQITAFKKMWIGTTEIAFSSFTPNQILTPLRVDGQPNYPARLAVSVRLGKPDQDVDPLLRQDFPNLFTNPVLSTEGAAIGNATSGAGIASAFNGVPNKATSASAYLIGSGALTLTIGKNWTAPKTIGGFSFTLPNDLSIASSVTVTLEGSNDNFATSTTLHTLAPSAYAAGTTTTVTSVANAAAAYASHRIKIAEPAGATGNLAVSQVTFSDLIQTDAFRQQGIATAVVRYHYGADYTEFTDLWGQVQKPNPLFLVDGIAIPDPRKFGTILDWDPNDPTSVQAARATWGFSNNASLVQAHYLTQRYGGRIDPQAMVWDKVSTAADYDDDLVYCLDGTYQSRYTVDGVVTLNQSPSDVLSGMIASNRGFVLESSGAVWVSSSKPRQPVATIYDALLTGAVSIRSAKPKRDLLNRVKTRFVAPDREYQLVDGPALSRVDLQDEDGELLDGTLSLPFTSDNRRAQRLSKAFLENGRLGKQITCRCDVRLLAETEDELIGNVVNFDSDLFSQGNGQYFVTGWGFSDSYASIDVSLTEYDPSLETDWVAAVDEQPFTIADLNVS